jgi:type VI secretion system VasD/TssJ family lipoprotein
MKKYAIALLILLTVSFTGEAATFVLQSTKNANVDENKQATPLTVYIFQMDDPAIFQSASFFPLVGSPQRALGQSFIDMQSFQLLPGQKKTINLSLDNDTAYIGVIAGYESLTGKTWRQVINRIAVNSSSSTALTFNNKGITVTQTLLPSLPGHFYLGLSGGLAFSSMGSNINFASQQTLHSNKSTSGVFEFDAGYTFSNADQTPILPSSSIQNINLGLSVLYLSGVTSQGTIDVPNDFGLISNSTNTSEFKLTSISPMLMARFNFEPWGGIITPFIKLGLGVALNNYSYSSSYSKNPNFNANLTNESSTTFAFDAGAGLEYAITKKFKVNLAYNYLNFGTMEQTAVSPVTAPNLPVSFSTVTLGLLYTI